jgi:hypothetical protein
MASSWYLSTKFVMIVINILTSSRISIEFIVRNTILALRWFVISSMISLTSGQHRLCRVWFYLTFRDNLGNVPLYLLCTSDPTLPWNTMLLLPRSMIVVFRSSLKTLVAHCQMFLDQLSKHHCMGNILNFPAPLTKWLATCYPDLDIMLCLSLGKLYSQYLCKITFSFPLFYLTFLFYMI